MEQTSSAVDPDIAARQKAIDNGNWIDQLLSSTGRHSIPPEVREEMMQCNSRAEINKIYFTYNAANPPAIQEMTDGQMAALDSMVSPITSPEYREADRLHRELQTSAMSRMRDVENYLSAAAKHYLKMEQLKGNASIPLSQKVQDVLSLGWYKLVDVEEASVAFSTPQISIKHYNPQAGINNDVLMGSYTVVWYPREATIKVAPGEGNISVNGYVHPHIGSSGSVCWGNAKAVAVEALSKFNPAPAMEALQTILQNYNAESPYVALDSFASIRNKDKYKGMPTTYRIHERTAWITEDYMPDAWAKMYQLSSEVYEDDEGDELSRFLMQVFVKVYEANGFRVADESETYYIKYSNGRMFAIDESDISDWE